MEGEAGSFTEHTGFACSAQDADRSYNKGMAIALPELKKQFLEYLEIERGRSPKTVENYDHYLDRFFAYCDRGNDASQDGRQLTLKDITQETIRSFRVWMNRHEPPLSQATQNYHIIALRMFLRYLARRGIPALAAERLELAKQPQRSVDVLDSDEVGRLMKAPEGAGMRAARDRAILETFFSTGLRVAELVALNTGSVDLQKGEFSVRGKGGKIRVVFLSERAKRALAEWLSARSTIIEPALFVRLPRTTANRSLASFPYSRLTVRSVQRLVEGYARKAGIVGKHVHPHVLRHSYATDLLRNGADLRSVQALLGHASITTTQVYTHVTDPQLKEIHRRYHAK